MKRSNTKYYFILLIMIGFTLSACAGFGNLKPVDKAAHVGLQLADYYETLYQQAIYINEEGNPDQQEFMVTHVNPVMNKAKDALIIYEMGILTWKASGEQPANIDRREENLRRLLDKAATMITEILGEA